MQEKQRKKDSPEKYSEKSFLLGYTILHGRAGDCSRRKVPEFGEFAPAAVYAPSDEGAANATHLTGGEKNDLFSVNIISPSVFCVISSNP